MVNYCAKQGGSKVGFGSKLSETDFSFRHKCSKNKIKPCQLSRQDTDPYKYPTDPAPNQSIGNVSTIPQV
jgi:hypothetical protein